MLHKSIDYFNYMAIDILARMGNFAPCENQIERVASFLQNKYGTPA
jgi:hypothetical protein